MTYTFLQEDLESILLFVTAPIYLTIIGILQSKNLKVLGTLKNKKIENKEKKKLLKKLQKLKFLTPILMLSGITIHALLYVIFNDEVFRSGYLISMGIMYVIYTVIALINFWLKGAGILKDIGDFNGLPGN